MIFNWFFKFISNWFFFTFEFENKCVESKFVLILIRRICVLFFFLYRIKVIKFGVFRQCWHVDYSMTNRANRSLLSLLSRSIGLEPSTPISNWSNGRTFLSIYARACDSHDFSGHDASNHEIPILFREMSS